MIQPKLKPCKHDGHLSYLWSHGYCKKHWMILTAKKQIAEMKKERKFDKDERFYRFLWNNRDRHCEECGRELKEFNKDIFHHLLKKSTHPYFRYEPKNIVLLCGKFGCHGKAESATSYPKMKIYEHCEKIKSELLESVGLSPTPKSSQEIKNRLTNFQNEIK